MRLEDLSVGLRQRSGWEAIDLGAALLRREWKAVYKAWLTVFLPLLLLAHLLVFVLPNVAWILLWWLKPWYDRVILHVLAGAVFGATPGWRQTVSELPRLFTRTRLLAGLTFFRLSPGRTLFLPVWQLEQLRGNAASARRKVLGRRTTGYAWGLFFICVHLEVALAIGWWMLTYMLLPETLFSDSDLQAIFTGGEIPLIFYHVSLLVSALTVSLIEPLFVASGFALYLNRRTELEGWDLELAFRRLTERATEAAKSPLSPAPGAGPPSTAGPGSGTAAALLLPAALAAALWLGGHRDAVAAPEEKAAATAVAKTAPDPKAKIDQVLAHPDFGQKETHTYWRPRWDMDSDKASAKSKLSWEWMETLAAGFRYVVWGGAAILLALGIAWLAKNVDWTTLKLRRKAGTRPDILFGLDVRAESLPADIPAAARARLAAGDSRGALSLLLRGALAHLLAQHFKFETGDTEGDCARRVEAAAPGELAVYFRRLVSTWQWVAYGHRSPEVTAVSLLIDQWRSSLETAAAAAAENA